MSKKDMLNNILFGVKIDVDKLLEILPQFKKMRNFDQKHPAHCYKLLEHTIKVVEPLSFKLVLKLAGLLHDFGKLLLEEIYDDKGVRRYWGHEELSRKYAKDFLESMGYDEKIVNDACLLIEKHGTKISPDKVSIMQQVELLGKEIFEMLIELQRADLLAHSEWYIEKKLNDLEKIEKIYYNEICKNN